MKRIKPPRLKKGDTIALVSPSGRPASSNIQNAIHRFREMGYRVRVEEIVRRTAQWGYLAGTDEERAESVNEAFRNPEADAIFCTAGGYGAQRILPLLDYDAIRDNPKILVGYSDITALHHAIPQRTGLITFHGPVASGVGGEFPDYNKEHLLKAIASEDPIGEIVNPVDGPYIKSIADGKATGELVGGNGSLISSLMGTPYELEMEGKIFLIENIKARPPSYVDRELTQLRLAGKLQKCAGIVYGECLRTGPEDVSRGQTMEEVVRDRIADLDVPAIYDLCCGHGKYKCTLPIGAKATVDAPKGKLIIEESAVS
jgi:muramoyltetrapeptide carboxypeptidase